MEILSYSAYTLTSTFISAIGYNFIDTCKILTSKLKCLNSMIMLTFQISDNKIGNKYIAQIEKYQFERTIGSIQ